MKPSLALSWFEQVQRLGNDPTRAAFLQQVTTDGTFETDYLEFKGCLQSGALLPDEKLRELYGKALSAFANTGGGVLIWGINATPDSTKGVDRAQSLALAPDVAVLYSKLDVIERDVTNPPVLGVQKFAVISEGTKGFVVCFIPESRWKPHARRKDGKDEYYYLRVSSHSVQADHSTLRRLFFPEYHSRLELYFHTKLHQDRGILQTDIFLYNGGFRTAEDVTVLFKNVPQHINIFMPSGWAVFPTAWGVECWRSVHAINAHEMRNLRTFNILAPQMCQNPPSLGNSAPEFHLQLLSRNEPPVEVKYTLPLKDVDAGNVRPELVEVQF